jgi:hypothetical protein
MNIGVFLQWTTAHVSVQADVAVTLFVLTNLFRVRYVFKSFFSKIKYKVIKLVLEKLNTRKFTNLSATTYEWFDLYPKSLNFITEINLARLWISCFLYSLLT